MRIIVAMAMLLVMEGLFEGLDQTMKHEIKQRFNQIMDQLGRFNRYIGRLDENMKNLIFVKAMELGKLIDENPQLHEFPGREEGESSESDSEVQGEV